MKTFSLLLLTLFIGCSNNTKSTTDNLQTDFPAESEADNIEINSTNAVIKAKTLDELFALWEQKLISDQIFDYVTESDCEDFDKMMELYEQDKYPMHADSKSLVEFDYNKDGIKDYVLNYTLMNCVRGNGWTTDFIFITSQDGLLTINENLTNALKQKYYDYVSNNYGEDMYVYSDNGFLVLQTVEINKIIDNDCIGTFSLSQDGASCCPKVSGQFSFNLADNDFKVFNVKREE